MIKHTTRFSVKVISFSLYGDNPIYTTGAIKNAELKETYFRDWKMWVYHNNSVPSIVLDELAALNVRLINTREENSGFLGSLWRFRPLADQQVERFISRDCDSRISIRDEIAVNEWINSEKKFHIIRDHPKGHRYLINAGMWGAKGNSIPNFSELMSTYIQKNTRKRDCTVDQRFLADVIYKLIVSDLFVHDEFFNYEGISIKIKRSRCLDEFAFIGEIIDEHGRFRCSDRRVITTHFKNNSSDYV